jgi:transposase
MIPTPTQVWLVVESIDMRAGIDGLSQRIQNTLGRSPCDGTAYAFRNRRQNRIKLLIWDGTGVWLCQRRACIAATSPGRQRTPPPSPSRQHNGPG